MVLPVIDMTKAAGALIDRDGRHGIRIGPSLVELAARRGGRHEFDEQKDDTNAKKSF